MHPILFSYQALLLCSPFWLSTCLVMVCAMLLTRDRSMLSKKGSGKRKVDLPSYYWPNQRSGIGSITASFSGRVLWKDQHHTVSRKEPNDASRWSSKVRYFAKTLESVFSLCVRLPTRSEGGS